MLAGNERAKKVYCLFSGHEVVGDRFRKRNRVLHTSRLHLRWAAFSWKTRMGIDKHFTFILLPNINCSKQRARPYCQFYKGQQLLQQRLCGKPPTVCWPDFRLSAFMLQNCTTGVHRPCANWSRSLLPGPDIGPRTTDCRLPTTDSRLRAPRADAAPPAIKVHFQPETEAKAEAKGKGACLRFQFVAIVCNNLQ